MEVTYLTATASKQITKKSEKSLKQTKKKAEITKSVISTRDGASVHNETTEKGISRASGHIPTVPDRYFKIYDYENERKGIMEKYIIENGITYELRGEQYYPVFKEPEQYQIGKYGLLHLDHIKAHRKPLYSTLLMGGNSTGICMKSTNRRTKW